MPPVDLDAVEAAAQDAVSKADFGHLGALAMYSVPALVAELRAAREVVEGGRTAVKAIGDLVRTTGNPNTAARVAYADATLDSAVAALDADLAAYDQVIGE